MSEAEIVRNLIVLQHEALKALTAELHQQTETFIQLTKKHPVTEEALTAAHTPQELPLRQSTADTQGPLISDLLAHMTRETCDHEGCIRSTALMTTFLNRASQNFKTNEDRLQALFILDLTLTKAKKDRKRLRQSQSNVESRAATANSTASKEDMALFFERERGYDMLVEWFAVACTYSDPAPRQLTRLVLQVLLCNKPRFASTRKMLTTRLRPLQHVVDTSSKDVYHQVMEKYREAA